VCERAALMRTGRVVETATCAALRPTPAPELPGALFPVSGHATGPDRTVVDVTFHGEAATQPVISQLARTYNIDISILGAAMDTLGGRQIGRMRIELPGRYDENVVPVGFLREQGLQVAVVDPDAPAPATRADAPTATTHGPATTDGPGTADGPGTTGSPAPTATPLAEEAAK
ncbi:NIL domain-containing protein, partial [Streptomyces fradiae]|uniref:NIL domain-containing protein n=1 Tax=Streptomyces fradiae TaxID=1906 RepID=UPI0036C4F3CB